MCCNRISHELMEALQMLKFSFRSGHILNFTAGTSQEDEVADLEQMSDDDAEVLGSSGNSFIQNLLAQDFVDD